MNLSEYHVLRATAPSNRAFAAILDSPIGSPCTFRCRLFTSYASPWSDVERRRRSASQASSSSGLYKIRSPLFNKESGVHDALPILRSAAGCLRLTRRLGLTWNGDVGARARHRVLRGYTTLGVRLLNRSREYTTLFRSYVPLPAVYVLRVA